MVWKWKRSCSVVSDSSRPHGLQPTRLLRPWDFPGKNTGVCCHFLLQCMKVKSESEVAQSCPTLHDPMDCSLPGSSFHRIFQARVLEWGAIALSTKLLGHINFTENWNTIIIGASQVASVVNNPPANAGDIRDASLIPGLERSPGGGHGNPLLYSGLENPFDRGAW